MREMFNRASSFNGSLSQWDVTRATSTSSMFAGATSFNGAISSWDVSNVRYMQFMFADATSFNQNLCWDVSIASITFMFSNSPGRRASYPDCDTPAPITMLTDSPSAAPTPAPTRVPVMMPTDSPSAAPTPAPIRLPTMMLTDSPSAAPTPAPTRVPTMMPTESPSASPTPALTILSTMMLTESPSTAPTTTATLIDNPFNILSGLSTDMEMWCIHPANNFMSSGTKIVIGTCKMNWLTYSWTFDYEGKIKNFMDPTFCIHKQNKRLILQKCVDGLRNQKWHYSSNRTLFAKNGRKGAVVEGGIASENAVVKNLPYTAGDAMDDATWDLRYVDRGILHMPTYTTFRIISDLTTEGMKWCMQPANGSISHGTKMAISTCKDWASFKWTMDNQGRLQNVKDPTKCITRTGKRMQLNDCLDISNTQRWAYSIIDRKVSYLTNGEVHATVVNSEASENVQVKSLPSEAPGPSYQTWKFEEMV